MSDGTRTAPLPAASAAPDPSRAAMQAVAIAQPEAQPALSLRIG